MDGIRRERGRKNIIIFRVNVLEVKVVEGVVEFFSAGRWWIWFLLGRWEFEFCAKIVFLPRAIVIVMVLLAFSLDNGFAKLECLEGTLLYLEVGKMCKIIIKMNLFYYF